MSALRQALAAIDDIEILLGNACADQRLLCAALREADEWRKSLADLTPNGSEFVFNRQACVDYVRDDRKASLDAIKRFKRRADEAQARVAELEACILKGRRLLGRSLDYFQIVTGDRSELLPEISEYLASALRMIPQPADSVPAPPRKGFHWAPEPPQDSPYNAWRTALEGLTPEHEQFMGDPAACVQYIRREFLTYHRQLDFERAKVKAAEAEVDVLKARVVELEAWQGEARALLERWWVYDITSFATSMLRADTRAFLDIPPNGDFA